jgi:hypothetical protein
MNLLDRRLSVAPMMEWTDQVRSPGCFKHLASAKRACHLYVSSDKQYLPDRFPHIESTRMGELWEPWFARWGFRKLVN